MADDPFVFRIKRVLSGNRRIPIVMQNINGPCPLLAICNALALRGDIEIHEDHAYIHLESLVDYVHQYLMATRSIEELQCVVADRLTADSQQRAASLQEEITTTTTTAPHENAVASLQENTAALSLQEKISAHVRHSVTELGGGMQVDVGFGDVQAFAVSPHTELFASLRLHLYHAWIAPSNMSNISTHSDLSDPANPSNPSDLSTSTSDSSSTKSLKSMNYNSLLDLILRARTSDTVNSPLDNTSQELATLGDIFLTSTASQITQDGIVALHQRMNDGEIGVFFRNNHFSVILRRREMLYLLVTDLGFFSEPSIMWESLQSVDGDTRFYSADFDLYVPKGVATTPFVSEPTSAAENSLTKSDHDLALQLQQEEEHAMLESEHHQPRHQPQIPAEPFAEGLIYSNEGQQSLHEETDEQMARRLQREEDLEIERARERHRQRESVVDHHLQNGARRMPPRDNSREQLSRQQQEIRQQQRQQYQQQQQRQNTQSRGNSNVQEKDDCTIL